MTDKPNIVLVTIDSIRADRCSATGGDGGLTPAIDRLASDGVVYENAVAPGPATPESMPAIFSGQYIPGRGRETDYELMDEFGSMRDQIRRHMAARDTLPEKLARRGYTTAAFTPNPFTSRHFGFDQGFDHFEDFLDSPLREKYGGLLQKFTGGEDIAGGVRLLLNLLQREEAFKSWESYYDDARAWAEGASEPYFLWLHTMDAHVPYFARGDHRSQSWWELLLANFQFWREDKQSAFDPALHDRLVTAYDDSIRYSDALIGRLVEDLGTEATAFVVHGDHGEAFGEHGTYGHEPYLYEENIHVPLVVGGGGVESRRVKHPVSLRSFPELLVRLAGGADRLVDPQPFAVSRTPRRSMTAVRGERVKYIHQPSGTELYDLAQGEQEQISNEALERLCQQQVDAFVTAGREIETLHRVSHDVG